MRMTPDAIRLVLPGHKADYDQKRAIAKRAREDVYALVQEADAQGMTQAELVSLTGWTRETIRKIVKAGKDVGQPG